MCMGLKEIPPKEMTAIMNSSQRIVTSISFFCWGINVYPKKKGKYHIWKNGIVKRGKSRKTADNEIKGFLLRI